MEIGERRVGRIGLGTNRLTDTEANRAFLRSAVAAGVSHIDTAHLYSDGDSERTIGRALAPFADDLLVATKCGYNGNEEKRIRSEVEQSLKSLGAGSIHLLYLHRAANDTPIERSMELFAELRSEGKVENVGISEVSIGQIDKARQVVPIAAVQNEFNLAERKHDEVVDFCAVEGVAFVPFFPLRGKSKAADEIAAARGASANQVKLAWLLKRSRAIAPIPGSLSLAHVEENLAAHAIELSDEEYERLDARPSPAKKAKRWGR